MIGRGDEDGSSAELDLFWVMYYILYCITLLWQVSVAGKEDGVKWTV